MAPKHDGFRDFVLDQLNELPGLTCRAMFGGYGLYCESVLRHHPQGPPLFQDECGPRRLDIATEMKPFKPTPNRHSKTITKFRWTSWKMLEN